MIIDAHSHLKHGDTFRREIPPDNIVERLDEAGIDKACVFSVQLPSFDSNELTRVQTAGRDRLIPFAHVVVQEGHAAEMELERAIKTLGFRGLKLHCSEVRGEEPTVEHFIPALEQAASYRLPIIFDCVNRPELTVACAEAVPEARLLVAHMGSTDNPFMQDRFIEIAYRHDNVWLDTSFNTRPWKIADALRVLGAGKLIFGSDGGGDYYPPIVELTKVRAYVRDDQALELILGGNIAQLLAEVRSAAE